MGWKQRSEEVLVEIAQIGISSSRTSYVKSHNLPNQDLNNYISPLDPSASVPSRTVISQFQQTVYASEVEITFQNPKSSQERQGVIQELWAVVRDNKIISDLGSKVLFTNGGELETLRYIAGGINYVLTPTSKVENYPDLVVKDTRDLPSSLEGSFSEEMEAEFRKLPRLCGGIAFDLEHCLGFLRE